MAGFRTAFPSSLRMRDPRVSWADTSLPFHADLRLPARLTDWSDHHVLIAMARRGEDLPGNLLVGEESFARWQALDRAAVPRSAYPTLADATIAGHPPGHRRGASGRSSGCGSTGGTCWVKFAARGEATAVVARRWCDLLVLEGVALEVVGSEGSPQHRFRVIDTPSHWFLESERFDRVGARGGRSTSSGGAS